MFERFDATYRPAAGATPAAPWTDDRISGVPGFAELIGTKAGVTFNDGLYRVHSATSRQTGQDVAQLAFPQYASRVSVFAFDWLGRQFALDLERQHNDEPLVLMLEPGTGTALEIPSTLVAFHDDELVTYSHEALASEFFAQWAAANADAVPVALDQCVGYRVPLFLGGQDTLDNLEVIDFEVYWTLTGQMRAQTHNLPPGITIGHAEGEA